jgi:hypothetical protein
MCKHSFIFQDISKKLSGDELNEWFHKFVKSTYNETMHKDCEKRIQNLKSMIKAVSGNNIMPINDLEYTRKEIYLPKPVLPTSNGISIRKARGYRYITTAKACI